MDKYYVSGCKDNGSEIETCDESEATFWTLYERKDNGLSHALLDCVDRLGVEAAMRVYVERDQLQEQVRALESKTSMTMGVGDGSGKLFVHGDYDSIKAAQAIVLRMEESLRERDALQEQVKALAAENVAQRDHCDEVYDAGYQQGHLNTVDGIAYAPGIKDDFYHDALQVMAEVETPATDAVIREIGAKAVEGFGASLNGATELWFPEDWVADYSDKLRAGEQP